MEADTASRARVARWAWLEPTMGAAVVIGGAVAANVVSDVALRFI